jgi:hypothetical protein
LLIYFVRLLIYFVRLLIYFVRLLIYFVRLLIYFVRLLIYFVRLLIYFVRLLIYFARLLIYSCYARATPKELNPDNPVCNTGIVAMRGGNHEVVELKLRGLCTFVGSTTSWLLFTSFIYPALHTGLSIFNPFRVFRVPA